MIPTELYMFITCALTGGLGNQLFQLFATISYAIRCSSTFRFANISHTGGITCRPTYWNSFLSKLRIFLSEPSQFPPLTTFREKGFHYDDLDVIEMRKRDVLLKGYFQSYKYFEAHYESIARLMGIPSMRTAVQLKVGLDTSADTNSECLISISVHFRRGDYVHLPEHHPLLPREYYLNALQRILEEINKKEADKATHTPVRVYYFCEKADLPQVEETILYLLTNLSSVPFECYYAGKWGLNDWEEMLLMSICHHHIIANSTFSWWGAYMNPRPDKIVCYPSKWFGTALNHYSTTDLCPEEWISIPYKHISP